MSQLGGAGDVTRRSVIGSAPSPGIRRSVTMPVGGGTDMDTARPVLSPIRTPPLPNNNNSAAYEAAGLVEQSQRACSSGGQAWPAQVRYTLVLNLC